MLSFWSNVVTALTRGELTKSRKGYTEKPVVFSAKVIIQQQQQGSYIGSNQLLEAPHKDYFSYRSLNVGCPLY